MTTDVRQSPGRGPLRLLGLGGSVLLRARGEVEYAPVLEPTKALALLWFLNRRQGTLPTREELIHVLYPDADSHRARANLRQALLHLNRTLGVGRRQPDGYPEVLPIPSDVGDFELACEEGRFADAVALYRGPFAEDLSAFGGAAFSHWCDGQRERLSRQFGRAAAHVVARRMDDGRLAEAVTLARAWRDARPTDAEAWIHLLQALHARQDRAALEIELVAARRAGVHPPPEVSNTSSEGSSSISRLIPGRIAPDLVGRAAVVAEVLARWEVAAGGQPQFVEIVGEAGLGKSRLLQHVAEVLQARSVRARTVRATPGHREVPFAFLATLVATIATPAALRGIAPDSAATLLGVTPALSTWLSVAPDDAAGTEAVRRRGIALGDLLLALSEQKPALLGIDDAHWIDEPSRQALAIALHGLGDGRVMVIVGTREASDIVPASATWSTTLLPLDVQDVEHLAASVARFDHPKFARQLGSDLYRATGGSPLLVVESLQLLIERGRLEVVNGRWHVRDPEGMALDLGDGAAILRRVADLPPTSRQLVLTLAVAGTPLTVAAVSTVVDLEEASVARQLGALDARGIVRRTREGWTTAHDEWATAAVAIATEGEHGISRRRLAEHFANQDGASEAQLTLAAQLAERAGRRELATRCFTTLVQRARARGDRRRNRVLAREVLGESTASRSGIRALVRELPWSLRLGLYSTRRLVGLGVVVAAAVSSVLLRPPGGPDRVPDDVLVIFAPEDGEMVGRRVPVYPGEWPANGEPIVWEDRSSNYRVPLAFSPSTTGRVEAGVWLGHRAVDEVTTIDVFSADARGRVTRLTDAPGDDGSPSTSPDGTHIVFATARWHPQARYDLAIMERATGTLRQLTRGPDTDGDPAWREDGLAIAFTRDYWDGGSRAICVVAPDGAEQGCTRGNNVMIDGLVGWHDASHVVVRLKTDAALELALLDLSTGASRSLLPEGSRIHAASVSANGRWLACQCDVLGFQPGSWLVFPVGRPELARQLRSSSALGTPRHVLWEGSTLRRRHVERLTVTSASDAVVGVPHRLLAAAWTVDSQPVVPANVRWQTPDPTVATIHPESGELLATRPGLVTVLVSAGGWRTDTATVRVLEARRGTSILVESWDKGLAQWIPFGTPMPRTVQDTQLGWTLLNNGDGAFTSGVVSRARFPTSGGLSLHLTVALPLTLPQDQGLHIGIVADPAGVDDAALALGDIGPLSTSSKCEVAAPAHVGPAPRTIALRSVDDGREETVDIALTEEHARGRPFEVLLQVLPDGRCGATLLGATLWSTTAAFPRPRQARVVVRGNSVSTKVLAGPLVLASGPLAVGERARQTP